MRFRRRPSPCLAACAVAFGVALCAPGGAIAQPLPASVRVKGCQSGSDSASRAATFVGRMHSIPGSVRMGMRFRLVMRSTSPSTAAPTASPDGPWWMSNDGVDRYTYSQTVNGMSYGKSYRVVARFRWIDSSGNVIRRTKRTSAPCTQPGPPNLTILGIGIAPRPVSGTDDYRIQVANQGQGPADRVLVQLFLDNSLVDSRRIKRLPGETTRVVTINGPQCLPGQTVKAVVDPANEIQESNENDNTFERGC
ncbi:MAG: hypothetical protein JOZ25_11150 [Actinobacteria bacterium]|nr:hypothetical protein [Actinomycetota bacterium]